MRELRRPEAPARQAAALLGRALLRPVRRRCGVRLGRGRRGPGGTGARRGRHGDLPLRRDRGGARSGVLFERLDAGEQRAHRAVEGGPRRLHERELEAGARVGAGANRLERLSEELEHPHDDGVGYALGLLGERRIGLGGERQLRRDAADGLDDHRLAQPRLEVAREGGRVPALRRRSARAPPGRRARRPRRPRRSPPRSGASRRRRARPARPRARSRSRCRSRAAPACRARRGSCRSPSGRWPRRRAAGSRSSRRPRRGARRRRSARRSGGGSRSGGSGRSPSAGPLRPRSWRARTRCLGGGSSSVFRNAFHAAVESMCASSRM